MEPLTTDLLVIGAGPGGYAAASEAAGKGLKVILVEQDARLGGVCLNRGCIPSKALLHATGLIRQAKESGKRGITFGQPSVNLQALRAWKASILEQLGGGLDDLSRSRGIQVVRGQGRFEDSQTLRVATPEGEQRITCRTAIIATGSRPATPQAFALTDPRIMTATEALELDEIPGDLLVVGGGYIGLELGTVYATLGSRVVLVEMTDSLLPGVDADLVRPVKRAAEQLFTAIRLSTTVVGLATSGRQVTVTCAAGGASDEERYDRVLVAVGRAPNCDGLELERTRVARDEHGFIQVDANQQTADPAIYAIGDVIGGALLAHKASADARMAVAAITGEPRPEPTGQRRGEPRAREHPVIPAVVFTDPEIAWCGLTEAEAKGHGLAVEVARFPWSASGRAVTLDRPDGLTKLLIEPQTERVLGVGIVGVGAGELISEGVLALAKGATARDLAQAVHPHPTLSETLQECAASFYGTATHVLSKKPRGASLRK